MRGGTAGVAALSAVNSLFQNKLALISPSLHLLVKLFLTYLANSSSKKYIDVRIIRTKKHVWCVTPLVCLSTINLNFVSGKLNFVSGKTEVTQITQSQETNDK